MRPKGTVLSNHNPTIAQQEQQKHLHKPLHSINHDKHHTFQHPNIATNTSLFKQVLSPGSENQDAINFLNASYILDHIQGQFNLRPLY